MIKILKARGESIKDSIVIEAKKEIGLYDLLVKKAKLDLELGEIKDQIQRKIRKIGQQRDEGYVYVSPLDELIDMKMEEVNGPLAEAEKFRNSLMREIKLSTGTPEVKALFDKLAPEVEVWMKKALALPPVKVKALSEKDKEVLKIRED